MAFNIGNLSCTLAEIRLSIKDGYLPEDFFDEVRNRQKLVRTEDGYICLQDDTIKTSCGCIFHTENDSNDYGYDDIDDVYRCSDDIVYAIGRRGREVYTSIDNCVQYRREYYVTEYLSDNNLCECEGAICCQDDCYYWDSDGEYHSDPEDNDEDNDEDNEIWPYDSGPTEKYFVDSDSDGIAPKFGFGIEIEKNEMPTFNFDKKELYEETGAVIERDSSVNSGFELKTPVYNLFSKETEKRLQPLKPFADIRNVQNAGGHVGFSQEGKNDIDLLNSVRGWLPLIYAMYRKRITNTYCQVKKIKALMEQKEKFQSIRLRGNYIEFRIFSSVRNFNTIIFRLNLFRCIAKNLNASFSKVFTMAISKGTELNTLLRSDVYSDNNKFAEMLEHAAKFQKEFGTGYLSENRMLKIQSELVNLKMTANENTLQELKVA